MIQMVPTNWMMMNFLNLIMIFIFLVKLNKKNSTQLTKMKNYS